MMSTAVALSNWFQQFGLPVYLEGDVPDEAEAPYITLPLREAEWDRQVSYQFNVWYRTTSNLALIAKADEIMSAVGHGCKIPLENDEGWLVLYLDTPTINIYTENSHRAARINLIMNSYHMPGV